MSDQHLTQSPEKAKQRNARRESRPDSVPSYYGGLHPILQLQRNIGNRRVTELIHAKRLTPQGKILGLQRKLTVGAANDQYEQEADRVADQVMRMRDPALARSSIDPTLTRALSLQRKCQGCKDEEELQRQPQDPQTETPSSGLDRGAATLSQSGQPLDANTRAFFEPRFGTDFSAVRIHTDTQAAESARSVNALAYTVGHNVVFNSGQYTPQSDSGKRLLAHELTHVVQQGQAMLRRQSLGEPDDSDAAAEREYGDKGAPKALSCGRPSWCPAGFCSPYSSAPLAEYYRSKKAPWLLAGIAAAVDSRVVPLWREYLWGGSPAKNLSGTFGSDFTKSPTTRKTTEYLYKELKASLAAAPPFVPMFSNNFLDLKTLIPMAISALGDPASPKQMNFNVPKDIPGNIAGGIGVDQLACPAGAQPSPFNDERHAHGMVNVARTSETEIVVMPSISYTVKDTIDLCPGDCGTFLEQLATVPLSQFEATGISGDVPFTVDFPAPSLGSFTVAAPLPKGP